MDDSPLLMTVAELIAAVGGSCLCDNSEAHGCTSVVTDSRNVSAGALFIPLLGELRDGHDFVEQAMQTGASVIFVDEVHVARSDTAFKSLAGRYGSCVIAVKDTLHALQSVAAAYVNRFPQLLRIGITGSSGKTTTKELIGSIFSQKNRVVLNEGNLNSETGLPLSVFRIRKEHQVGVFELGMNRKGEISELTQVLKPSLAVITNIGTAHIGILGSQKAIAEEKKEIFSCFDSDGTGFIPEDESWGDFLSDVSTGTIRRFGLSTTEGVSGSEDLGIEGSVIHYEGLRIHLPLPGVYNLENALAAISVARFAGISARDIQAGIESVQPLFGRAQILHGNGTVVLDCYNANPDSMERAIEFWIDQSWTGKKIFVLGSMLELGTDSASAHQHICSIVAKSDVETVFLFGEEMTTAGRSTEWERQNVQFFTDIEQLKESLKNEASEESLVFIKGSRGMALERLCPALGIPEEVIHG